MALSHISDIVLKVFACCEQLRLSSPQWDEEFHATWPQISAEIDRFRVWSENIGAHRKGRVSLDYRVREAARLRKVVLQLLDDLGRSFDQVIDLTSGARLPYERDLAPESDLESESTEEEASIDGLPDTEIAMLLSEITNVVDHLYAFTIYVNSSTAPRDTLRKAAQIGLAHFQQWDVLHVRQKFPDANEVLVARLGRANTTRRQIFKYSQIHHWKLAKSNDEVSRDRAVESRDQDPDDAASIPDQGTQTLHTREASGTEQRTVNTQTTMETLADGELELDLDDAASDGTSALSEASSAGEDLNFPDLPDRGMKRKPFQCDYCFEVIRVSSAKSWRTHVLRDLKPYTCTFGNCPQSSRIFESRHEWFAHELDFHRHSIRGESSPAPRERRPPQPIQQDPTTMGLKGLCPLCTRSDVTIRSHVAKHLQALALFVLPRATHGDEEEDAASDRVLDWTSDEDSLSSLGSIDQVITAEPEPEPEQSQTVGGRLADFNLTTSQSGQSLLLNAASSNNVDLLRYIVAEPGCNIEVRDDRDQTPISRAAETGASAAVRFLLSLPNVQVNDRDRVFKRTPLNWAAGNGHIDAVRALLLHPEVDVNASDKYKRTPLWRASAGNHAEVVRVLVADDRAEVDRHDRYLRTPFSVAASGGHVNVMKTLSEKDIDINHADNDDVTPLGRAAAAGRVLAVQFLLSQPTIDTEALNEDGKSPLMLAAENRHLTVVKMLIERGASTNTLDKTGQTPLIRAADVGDIDMVTLLCDNGSNVLHRDNADMTALQYASSKDHVAIVDLLRERSSEPAPNG